MNCERNSTKNLESHLENGHIVLFISLSHLAPLVLKLRPRVPAGFLAHGGCCGEHEPGTRGLKKTITGFVTNKKEKGVKKVEKRQKIAYFSTPTTIPLTFLLSLNISFHLAPPFSVS